MSRNVTIVAYHYVRDLARSRYPHIKAMTTDDFKKQLTFIKKKYQVITMETML